VREKWQSFTTALRRATFCQVKAMSISNGSALDLSALRADVLAKGGTVYFCDGAASALWVLLPANQVGAIAMCSDVQIISPGRLTRAA
jgi:hypothetical protein